MSRASALSSLAVLLLLSGCASRAIDRPAPVEEETSDPDPIVAPGSELRMTPLEDAITDEPDDDAARIGKASSALTTQQGWRPMASARGNGIGGRYDLGSVWAGDRLLIWGGNQWDTTLGNGLKNDGATYDPTTNVWTKLPPSPLVARAQHLVAFTGARVYVWGGSGQRSSGSYGRLLDGASYTLATNKWFKIPSARGGLSCAPKMVWAPERRDLFFWGCYDPQSTVNGTGMRYHPSTHSWYYIPKAPLSTRRHFSMTWAGGKLWVLGGIDMKTNEVMGDGAVYDPSSKTWRHIAKHPSLARVKGIALETMPGVASLFDGTRTDSAEVPFSHMTNLHSATNVLDRFTYETVLPTRSDSAVFWGAGKLWFFGGTDGLYVDHRDGATYEEGVGWTKLPDGGPDWRHAAVGAWTGSEAILYGGLKIEGTPGNDTDGILPLADGMIYRP